MISPRKAIRQMVAAIGVCVALGLLPSAVRADPPSKYSFPLPPTEIHNRLGSADLGPFDPLPPGDVRLLADFWARRTAGTGRPVPEADDAAVTLYLIASGVTDANARADYLARFGKLVADARAATAGAADDREKADRLLRFLHRGVMAGRYHEDQSTVCAVFDTGKFNCVSSAAVYYLVGTRLGLKLQPILIPGLANLAGHAAVDLIDGGKRIDIEPTNADGFSFQEKRNRPGVVSVGPKIDRQKAYDTDGFGLAAAIANNRAVDAAKASPRRPLDAMRCQVVALVLAPTDPGVTNNTIAVLQNWGIDLAKGKKYEDAIKVAAFTREVLGRRPDTERNYLVFWTDYVDEAFAAGRVADGLQLQTRARAAFPNEKRFADAAGCVTRAAQRKADSDGWAAGLAVADAALPHLAAADAKTVRAWKDGARRQWSQSRLDKGDVAESMKILSDGMADSPGSPVIEAGIRFHTQEALDYLLKIRGRAAAVAHYKELVETFPDSPGVKAAGAAHATRVVGRLCDEKKFADAMTAADDYKPLAGNKADDLKCVVYDAWARSLVKDGKPQAALEKYAEGLAVFPKSDLLRNNARVTVDQWAYPAVRKKDWKEAVRIYEIGLEHLPDDPHLRNKREYCRKQMK